MKINITIYKKYNYYSIYNGDKPLHSGDTKGKDAFEIVKELGYTIIRSRLESSYNWNTTNYSMEVK